MVLENQIKKSPGNKVSFKNVAFDAATGKVTIRLKPPKKLFKIIRPKLPFKITRVKRRKKKTLRLIPKPTVG